MSWAQRLKRVFNIDIEVCGHCGGSVKVIACIEDQNVIPDKAGQALDRILAHLREKEKEAPAPPRTTNQGATCHAVSFRREVNRVFTVRSARTPLKNSWHGLLRALGQEGTDMNCAITSANNFSGQSAVISRISPVQSAVSVRKPTLNRPFIWGQGDSLPNSRFGTGFPSASIPSGQCLQLDQKPRIPSGPSRPRVFSNSLKLAFADLICKVLLPIGNSLERWCYRNDSIIFPS